MARSAGWPTRRARASGHVSPVTVRVVHGWLVSAGTTLTRMVNTIHMETPKVEDQEGQEGQDKDPAPVHYSTGLLHQPLLEVSRPERDAQLGKGVADHWRGRRGPRSP